MECVVTDSVTLTHRCFNASGCTTDPRLSAATSSKESYCANAAIYGAASSSKAAASPAPTAASSSAAASQPSATTSSTGAAKTGAAADLALNVGGVLAVVAGAVAAVL